MKKIDSQYISKSPGETFKAYGNRLYENMNVYGLTSQQIADLLNKESGESKTESAYRKYFKAFREGRLFEREKESKNYLIAQAKELEKAKIGLSQQRAALKRNISEEAKRELLITDLKEQFARFEPIEFKQFGILYPSIDNGDTMGNTMVVCVSDLHLGIEFDNAYGRYSPSIAKDRMEHYAARVVAEADRYGTSKCLVVLLGDLISGVCHTQIRIENRENYVGQIKTAGELISQFLASISRAFSSVDVYGAPGNHSRAVPDERDALIGECFDNLIPWYLTARLASNSSITVHDQLDVAELSVVDVNNKTVVLSHGHLDNFGDNGLSLAKLCNMIGRPIDYVFCGHMHSTRLATSGKAQIIQSGSLCGSGDSYTLKHRLTGRASQAITIINTTGDIEGFVPVYFD